MFLCVISGRLHSYFFFYLFIEEINTGMSEKKNKNTFFQVKIICCPRWKQTWIECDQNAHFVTFAAALRILGTPLRDFIDLFLDSCLYLAKMACKTRSELFDSQVANEKRPGNAGREKLSCFVLNQPKGVASENKFLSIVF